MNIELPNEVSQWLETTAVLEKKTVKQVASERLHSQFVFEQKHAHIIKMVCDSNTQKIISEG